MKDIMVTVDAPINDRTGPKLGKSSAIPMTRNMTVVRTTIRFHPNSKITNKNNKYRL